MSKQSDESVHTTKRAYDEIHSQYSSYNTSLNEDVRRNLDRFTTSLSGKSVLDVGCASGRESEFMHGRGFTVSGCDISEEFIREAQERCPDCEFFVADMRSIQGRANLYDGIWANASFLHIPKADALVTLKNFHSILKKRGVLYISVMRGEFDGLRENKQMSWPERHFSDYHEEELVGLLTEAGFQVLDSDSNTTDWGPTFLHYFCRRT